jgi:acetyl-CoA carboxylase carboxyl transferase subunit beta
LDGGIYEERDAGMTSGDPLQFTAKKKYTDQIAAAQEKTGQKDVLRTITGKMGGQQVILAIMDFSFIGGSMGSVVGEKLSRAIKYAIAESLPLITIAASGGARMQEGIFSLMQMAKISAKLARLAEAGGLHISILTDPTTGGVTASYAMLGDFILAEPGALIGFAGPRVIKQTIGQDLPEGFQRAEFVLEKGFIDHIVTRSEMKEVLIQVIKFANA